MATENKVVLVTGASRGLGKKLALSFASSGFRVAVHFRSGEREAAQVVTEIRKEGGKAVPLAADLSDPSQVEGIVRQILEAWGRVDVLINNAAMIKDAPVVSLSEEDWDDVIGLNLSGPFYIMRTVSSLMREQGGGDIINILSIAGVRGSAGQSNYAAAKAGLLGLTRAVAREWGPYNIRVNAVSPGFMETDMTRSVSENVRKRVLEQSCLNKFCDPEDVVLLIESLIRMRGVTGQLFHIDSRIS